MIGPRKSADLAGHDANPSLKDPSVYGTTKDKFRVSGDGVFYTLQGEGVTMGLPSVFLRLHHCNLACTWCDAWYTWDERSEEFWTESKVLGIDETRKQIIETWQCKNKTIPRRLVVTGGEPLIYRYQIERLISDLHDWDVEIETNGTIMPTTALLDSCRFHCSPKLRNSGNKERARIKAKVLQALNEGKTIFKFVVKSPEDIEEMERDFVIPLGLDPLKILIMPEGTTSEEVKANARDIVETVKAKGYRMLGRLHIDLWGDLRGV